MSCRGNLENIVIDPCFLEFAEAETVTVACVADIASSLNSTYFTFNTPTVGYYTWISTGAGIDPAIAGRTAIPVVIAPAATATAVALAIQTAIDLVAGVHAGLDGCDPTKVIIMAAQVGPVAAVPADGAGAGATEFVITEVRVGSSLQIGFTEDFELPTGEVLVDVTTSQTGGQILTALRSGRNVENISVVLKEAAASKLKVLLEASGSTITPPGIGATEVTGYGSQDTKAFGNAIVDSKRLILHPVRKAESDRSEDFCFWRAYPQVTSISISGSDARTISVDFRVFEDSLIKNEVRQFIFGDWQQKLLV
jgi:hypothetical protein